MASMRRVVVTGMGIVSPLGIGVEHVWRRLINGESGISAIQSFDVADMPCRIAGTIPRGTKADGKLDVKDYDRTVAELMAGGSDPVITKKPEGAYSFAVYDAMK